jgi:hypothetical protein
MPSSNNPLVLCISCYVFSSTLTHWTADWILTGVQVVPVMPIGSWEECLSRYQQFLSPVYWFIFHTLPGSGSAFREQHCKSDFKIQVLFVAHLFNYFFFECKEQRVGITFCGKIVKSMTVFFLIEQLSCVTLSLLL